MGLALIVSAGLVPLPGSPAAAPAAADVTFDACGVVTTKADGSPWTCSFVDDFDGTTLDPAKWIVQDTVKTGFRSQQTCFTATERNVKVADGVLALTAQDEGAPINCKNFMGDFWTRYTGGMVGTKGKFSQTFGRFEVRAKLPAATTSGLHGGFWMLPIANKYGVWPNSGEIDVAEWWSADPSLVLPSLHYRGRDFNADSGWGCRITDLTGFHTYTVEWAPTGFSFAIDGTVCFTRTPTTPLGLVAPAPFDQPFSMILNMGVGMPTGTNKTTASTPFPAAYEVDYAKSWR
ncbi:glycoside hydrolase family 16 protein [Nocardioides stalactiti]|uniref:glycoside hydrolase family 16 protein n=1 Tax=Nocardioides stalactiti TaxID=2755356 RepID=UPI001602A98F|nr:glycoside hydrolase family 16 protein [Nocardioides stalactiti]